MSPAVPEPPEARCETTELLVDACACRLHRGAGKPDTPLDAVETVGQPFEAAYGGQCIACPALIRPGQLIARAADEPGYVHAEPGCAL